MNKEYVIELRWFNDNHEPVYVNFRANSIEEHISQIEIIGEMYAIMGDEKGLGMNMFTHKVRIDKNAPGEDRELAQKAFERTVRKYQMPN